MNEAIVREDYFLKMTLTESTNGAFNTKDFYFYDNDEYILVNKQKLSPFSWNTENTAYKLGEGIIEKLKNYLYVEEDVFHKEYPYCLILEGGYKMEIRKDGQVVVIENNFELMNQILCMCGIDI